MTGAALVTSALMAGFVIREATTANPLLSLAVLAAVATARTDAAAR